jgi:hypothetical protein
MQLLVEQGSVVLSIYEQTKENKIRIRFAALRPNNGSSSAGD